MKTPLPYNWNLSPETPFVFGIQCFPEPSDYPSLDLHRSIHLNLVLNGSLTGKAGNRVFHLRQYDLQITAPWEPHGENRIEKGLCLLSITADPDLLTGNLIEYREKALTLFLLDTEERHRIVNTEATLALRSGAASALPGISGDNPKILKLRRWLAIQNLLGELLNGIPEKDLPSTPFRLFQKLSGALDLLKAGRHITIREAAAACSLSESRFGHLFRQLCRMSFSEYEMRNRLNRAAFLLQHGLPVKTAAEQEGFYDASHFIRHFQKQFGMTPGKFR